MPRSPQWMDLYQIWFRVSSRGRNQLCGILLQSAHGFRFCGKGKITPLTNLPGIFYNGTAPSRTRDISIADPML